MVKINVDERFCNSKIQTSTGWAVVWQI